MPVWNQLSIHSSLGSRLDFNKGGQPRTKLFCSRKISRTFFEAKKNAVFINLTAAYDAVWHRGLTCKLLKLLLDKHMIRMVLELIRNRSFILTTGDSKRSRLRRLRNSVPRGTVLAPLLFNIYIYNLPSPTSGKYAYADHLV